MKKSLVALAAMAFVGAASAQSSVTLYGLLDVGYGGGTANGVDVNFQQQSSFNSASKFGFKGSEDIGGGLKANFQLETGNFDMETGSTSLNLTRAAWMGLSGGFGEVRFGRIVSVPTQVMGQFDFEGISSSSAPNNAGLSPVTWYGSSRRNSQFQYNIPMGDVKLYFADTLDNDNGGKNNRATLAVNYAKGPLAVGFVTESASTDANRTAYALGASYDFGAAKVGGQYVQSELEAKGQGFTLSVQIPVGGANVGIQYAHNNQDNVPIYSATELYANYALSKRTTLYVDSVFMNDTAGGANKAYNFGIMHAF